MTYNIGNPSGAVNAKSYGAVLNGIVNDSTAFQNIYNAVPSDSIIQIPSGSGLNGSYTSSSNKSVLWQTLGTFDYAGGSPFTPGTNPVTSMGDGDVLETFLGGRKRFSKSITTSTDNSGYATLEADLVWNGDTANAANAAFVASFTNSSNGSNSGGGAIIARTSITGSATDNYGIWSVTQLNIGSTGGGAAYYGEVQDKAGTTSSVCAEMDIYTTGADSFTGQNPGVGLRALINFNVGLCDTQSVTTAAVNTSTTIVVQSTTNISSGMVISGTGVTGSPTVASITNATTLVASSTQTIANGVALTFTAPNAQVSRGVAVGSNAATASVGSAFFTSAPLYWSAFDCSNATFSGSSVASLRMGPNQPIDFSAVPGTSSSINERIMQYSTAASGLTYSVSGTTMFSISDTGSIGITSTAGSWGGYNFGKNFLVYGSSTNPSIGIFDATGQNPWAITNNGSSTLGLSFASMPALSNSSTNPIFILTMTSGGGVSVGINCTSPMYTVGSSGPTITQGSGVPSSTQPVGSIYMRTGGSSGSRLYVSAGGGTWNAVSGV